jgi:hypothetical protein
MALTTATFSVTQSLANPSYLTFSDDSTGTDLALTERRIYIVTAEGKYLTADGLSDTPAYETWAIANDSQTFDVLPRDMAVSIVVNWMTGSTISYTKTINYVFTLYNTLFLYSLTSAQVSNTELLEDTTYFSNKMKMIVNLEDAETAVEIGDDIFAAQQSLDLNYTMIQNQSYYF